MNTNEKTKIAEVRDLLAKIIDTPEDWDWDWRTDARELYADLREMLKPAPASSERKPFADMAEYAAALDGKSPSERPTPRTDAATHQQMRTYMDAESWEAAWKAMAGHSRTLERELAEAQEKLESDIHPDHARCIAELIEVREKLKAVAKDYLSDGRNSDQTISALKMQLAEVTEQRDQWEQENKANLANIERAVVAGEKLAAQLAETKAALLSADSENSVMLRLLEQSREQRNALENTMREIHHLAGWHTDDEADPDDDCPDDSVAHHNGLIRQKIDTAIAAVKGDVTVTPSASSVVHRGSPAAESADNRGGD